MNERFELSFKNKIVKMWFILMIPTAIVQLFLILFTDVAEIIPVVLPIVPLLLFFIWLYFYKRDQKK